MITTLEEGFLSLLNNPSKTRSISSLSTESFHEEIYKIYNFVALDTVILSISSYKEISFQREIFRRALNFERLSQE